jgi:hypothetical protein
VAFTVGGVGADVDDADAVMRVEHGDGVGGALPGPGLQRLGSAEEQRMQHQRRQREVVHPVHPLRDLDLLAVVAVHLHQHLQPQAAGDAGEFINEGEGLGHHEAAVAWLLDGVAHRVAAHHRHAGLRQLPQDGQQVGLALRVVDVDVDLLGGEGGPQDAALAIGQGDEGERRARPRPVDGQQVFLGRTVREHRVHRQEQAVVGRCAALGGKVLELG